MYLEKCFFKRLSDDVRYIREKVFVEEQGFHNEFDENDEKSFHLVIYYDGKPAGTGRVFANDILNKVFTIGRVAVLSQYRNLHLGNKILESLEQKAREEGAIKIELSAQCTVQDFYRKNGYVASGDIYYDEFCPHIHMEKIL